jgi:hypothetical protein
VARIRMAPIWLLAGTRLGEAVPCFPHEKLEATPAGWLISSEARPCSLALSFVTSLRMAVFSLPALASAAKTTKIDRLVEVGAWCDAAFALIEIELPA